MLVFLLVLKYQGLNFGHCSEVSDIVVCLENYSCCYSVTSFCRSASPRQHSPDHVLIHAMPPVPEVNTNLGVRPSAPVPGNGRRR